MEEWKDIEEYPTYRISSWGRVFSTKTNKYLKPNICPNGYMTVMLVYGKRQLIHRLVAKAFISNPNNYSDCNHKDWNRQNNNSHNLEWISHTQNLIMKRDPPSKSGHRHIRQNGNKWEVRVQRDKHLVYCQFFTTLEEAIQNRNLFLRTYNQTQNLNLCIQDQPLDAR